MKSEELFYGTSIILDKNQCTGCAVCVDVCSMQVFTMDTTTGKVKVIGDNCNGCAACIKECPSLALQLGNQRPVIC